MTEPIQDTAREVPAVLPSGREPELELVMEEIASALETIESLRGPERDIALARVEGMAAPYALAFYQEIRRLDGDPAITAGT